MKALRFCICLLLLSATFIIASCGGGSQKLISKGSEQISLEVKINDCKVDPYVAAVYKTSILTWKVDSTDTGTYAMTFSGRKPVANASFQAHSTAPSTQAVKRDLTCWASWDHCYYDYTLTKNGVACPDPGVHIIPGP